MKIGVVGLGLIGGSVAKTIKKHTDFAVIGYDTNKKVIEKAIADYSIDKCSNDFSACDITIVSLYPEDTISFLESNAKNFKNGSIVVDCCGVKQPICNAATAIFKNTNISFVGGHPMAGREFSGYDYSLSTLFDNASMILTPLKTTSDIILEVVKDFFSRLKFKTITVTTPEDHDQVIAYTSQLAHIVSNAYMQSPTSEKYKGFSAGSFGDLTRVAKLNPDMWTELFLTNSQALVYEINLIINTLERFKFFLDNNKEDELKRLLQYGSDIKERLNKEGI